MTCNANKENCNDVYKSIVEELGFEPPEVSGYQIAVNLYIEPDRSPGGILYPEQKKDMDKFRSCVGKVIAMGPDAYKSERFASGPWTKIGNWVAIPRNEGIQFDYRGAQIMIIADDRIMLPNLADPTYVKRN